MTSASYAAHFSYPRKLYLEYSGLIIQSLVIFVLVIMFSHDKSKAQTNGTNNIEDKKHEKQRALDISFPDNKLLVFSLLSMTLIHVLVAFQLVNDLIPTAFILTSIASGPFSRLIQIKQIINRKDSGSLSALTWFLSTITTGCRFATNLLTVSDGLLLLRLGSATLLNFVLSIAIIYYRHEKQE